MFILYNPAKDITNGTFDEPNVTPAYDVNKANDFYSNKYSEPVIIDPSKLIWFPKVDPPTVQYDQTPYKPKDIKNALFKKNHSSAPGNDDIVYGYFYST
jgi:hypothetical protein